MRTLIGGAIAAAIFVLAVTHVRAKRRSQPRPLSAEQMLTLAPASLRAPRASRSDRGEVALSLVRRPLVVLDAAEALDVV